MYCNNFRKLKPQTCVSAHQNIINVCENTTMSSQMQAVKLPSIHGPSLARGELLKQSETALLLLNSKYCIRKHKFLLESHTNMKYMWCNAGLYPHPRPQKKVNGSSLNAEEQFLIFGLRCREDKTGEEVRLFIREGHQGCPASGTGAQIETCLPPLSVRRAVFQPVSAYKAEVLQSGRCKVSQFCIFWLFHIIKSIFNCVYIIWNSHTIVNCVDGVFHLYGVCSLLISILTLFHSQLDTVHKMEILHSWALRASMEEREMSQIELGAKQCWANYEASFCDSNPLKNEQKSLFLHHC